MGRWSCVWLGLTAAGLMSPVEADWPATAPEQLPPVTVRWLDGAQSEHFVVEGADYACRVATHPARIESLRIGDQELLPDGAEPSFEDAAGELWRPAPRELTPDWKIWQRNWVPAASSRARMNVWNAGPYYWDAHLLDIPFVKQSALDQLAAAQAAPPLAEYGFDTDAMGWTALHNCTISLVDGGLNVAVTGDDPYLESPPLDLPPRIMLELRLKSPASGGAAVYWATTAAGYGGEQVRTFGVKGDGEWHDYRIQIDASAPLRRLRFDPPGSDGAVQLDRIVIRPVAESGDQAPIRGELIFHATPEQLRIEWRFEPAEGQPAPVTLRWLGAPAGRAEALAGRPAAVFPNAAVLGRPDAAFGPSWPAQAEGPRPGSWWVIQPVKPGQSAAGLLANDLQPLDARAATVAGGTWLGYDEPSGLYRIAVDARREAFSFEPTYKVPNRRMETRLAIGNDAAPRRVLIKAETGIGNLEAAVLTDEHGFPLPTPAFVAKNFAGEREEPDDSGYGDSYFPLDLAAGEQRSFQLVHLNQNWGDHPLKQVSSIRFFNIYWHLSTGASETTCYTHNLLRLNGAWVRIPDFRPYSGEFWPGQPQHDCRQWPGFLEYNGEAGRPVYERTEFQSVSPNLARFTMYFHTADDAATARLEVMEIPQRDEMRGFVKLRYDFVKPVTIEGDARDVFRWCNINEKLRQASLVWTSPDATMQTRDVVASPEAMLLGEPLPTIDAVVGSQAVDPLDGYHTLVLIRSFRAKLGGREYDRPVFGARFREKGGDWWFSVDAPKLAIQPGDFLEADLMLMPHAGPVAPTAKPTLERQRFGAAGPRIETVSIGEKISDFPARVKAVDNVAALKVAGGYDQMPLIVEGLQAYAVPLLWRDRVWQDQQVHGGDGYQIEGGGDGYRAIFLYSTRTGQTHDLMVTLAQHTAGIAALEDDNGRLSLRAAAAGSFRLKAPVVLGPGTVSLAKGSPVFLCTSEAERIGELPLGIEPTAAQAELTIEAWTPASRALRLNSGAARVRCGGWRAGAHVVTVRGERREPAVMENGAAVIELVAGERVTVEEG